MLTKYKRFVKVLAEACALAHELGLSTDLINLMDIAASARRAYDAWLVKGVIK